MGQMRFWAAMSEFLPERATERAYLAGLDGIPWRSRNLFQDGVLTLDRGTHESGNLIIPWRTSQGILALSTGSLMERESAYHLAVELARGTLNRLRDQVGDFHHSGHRPSTDLAQCLAAAHEAFVRMASSRAKNEELTQLAAGSIEKTLACIPLLSAESTQVLLDARRRQAPQLPTLLAGSLERNFGDTGQENAFATAFNAASLPLNWREMEANAGQIQWDELDQRIAWCQRAGLRICAGPLLQLDRVALPDWLYLWEDDFEQLSSCVSDFVRSVVKRYTGKVNVWHVAARLNVGGELTLGEEQRLRLAVTGIETIRKLDSQTPIVISFDQPWGEYLSGEDHELSPLHFADALARADLGLAGLGMEINLGYWPDGTYPRDVLEIGRHIDRWSTLGLPILVVLTLPSGDQGDQLSWQRHTAVMEETGRTSPDTQRAWSERVLPVLIAKPMVHGIVWNQQSDAHPHAYPHGGLWDQQGRPKPVLESLAALRKRLLT